MKYEVDVTIHKGIEEVLETFQDREAAFKWIKGLTKFDLIEGELGKVDSKYVMEFVNKKGKTSQMTETIKELNAPESITTIYEMDGVWNKCENKFRGHADHTHYNMITEFKFPWYMSIFIWMFKGMFVKQSQSGLNDFKKYVESL